jgi:hypothetical protein
MTGFVTPHLVPGDRSPAFDHMTTLDHPHMTRHADADSVEDRLSGLLAVHQSHPARRSRATSDASTPYHAARITSLNVTAGRASRPPAPASVEMRRGVLSSDAGDGAGGLRPAALRMASFTFTTGTFDTGHRRRPMCRMCGSRP